MILRLRESCDRKWKISDHEEISKIFLEREGILRFAKWIVERKEEERENGGMEENRVERNAGSKRCNRGRKHGRHGPRGVLSNK